MKTKKPIRFREEIPWITSMSIGTVNATFADWDYDAIEEVGRDSETLAEFNARMLDLWKAACEREARED